MTRFLLLMVIAVTLSSCARQTGSQSHASKSTESNSEDRTEKQKQGLVTIGKTEQDVGASVVGVGSGGDGQRHAAGQPGKTVHGRDFLVVEKIGVHRRRLAMGKGRLQLVLPIRRRVIILGGRSLTGRSRR